MNLKNIDKTIELALIRKCSVFLIALFMILLLTGCGNVKVDKGAEEYIGSNYEDVIAELSKVGFRNIETIEINDLTSSDVLTDGSVSEVSIDGNVEYVAETAFSKDAKVIITYHIIKKLSVPIKLEQISAMNFSEIADSFLNAGFENVLTEEVYDLDPDEFNGNCQNEVKINGVTLSDASKDIPFDATINIICHYPYEKFEVQLNVDFIGNLIFSKYDVDLFIDDDRQDTLKHGVDLEKVLKLKEGEHIIRFVNAEDPSVCGEIVLDITGKTEVAYKIFCYAGEVTVDTIYVNRDTVLADNEVKILCSESDFCNKNYKDVKNELASLGFINIKTVPVYDIYFGITEKESVSTVTINGSDDFNRGDVFLEDVEVIVQYHMLYEEDPRNQDAEDSQNEEMGKTQSQDTESNDRMDFSWLENSISMADQDAEILDEYGAWEAVQRYGENCYPYFHVHSMDDKLSAEQISDNEWKLKAYCDVDKGQGKQKHLTCEATVEGTNLDASVTYFIVY